MSYIHRCASTVEEDAILAKLGDDNTPMPVTEPSTTSSTPQAMSQPPTTSSTPQAMSQPPTTSSTPQAFPRHPTLTPIPLPPATSSTLQPFPRPPTLPSISLPHALAPLPAYQPGVLHQPSEAATQLAQRIHLLLQQHVLRSGLHTI